MYNEGVHEATTLNEADKATYDEASSVDEPHENTDAGVEYFAEAESIQSKSSDGEHCTGAIFDKSHNFVVTGGVFRSKVINRIYQAPREVTADFRRIPLGDIYLREEIYSTVAYLFYKPKRYMRRVYSATVDGRSSNMTVAVYHGKQAKEAWRTDLAKNRSLRDSRFVQIFGVVRSDGIYATVFYDDLIPFWPILDGYSHSLILNVYLHAHAMWTLQMGEYEEASKYYSSISGRHWPEYFFPWVQPSTGRISFELGHRDFREFPPGWPHERTIFNLAVLEKPDAETEVARLMSLDSFHETAAAMPWGYHQIPFLSPVSLGSIFHLREVRTVASLVDSTGPRVDSKRHNGGVHFETMPNGWARCSSESWFRPSEFGSLTRGDPEVRTIGYTFRLKLGNNFDHAWLSQANYICNRLQITSELAASLFLVDCIEFTLTGSHCPPEDAYLFLCPPTDFCMGPATYGWPECPVYWSRDPSGVNRLSVGEAEQLGFPSFQTTTYADGWSPSTSICEALRQFHQAKGFDPYSQDVARHLGYPLYEVVDDRFEIVPGTKGGFNQVLHRNLSICAESGGDNNSDAGEQASESEDDSENGPVQDQVASNSNGSRWRGVKDAVDSLANLSMLAGIQIGAQQIDFLGFVA